jgi:uncharacterized membrane protein YadS
VHDTSQVVGSAGVYVEVFGLPQALDVATVTKLVRNVFMAAVIPLMAYQYNRSLDEKSGSQGRVQVKKLFPLFVLGFLAMAVFRSLGDAWARSSQDASGMLDQAGWTTLIGVLQTWAGYLLVAALAGVGLSTDIQSFKGLGVKPFLVGLSAALAVGVVSYLTIILIGGLVSF